MEKALPRITPNKRELQFHDMAIFKDESSSEPKGKFKDEAAFRRSLRKYRLKKYAEDLLVDKFFYGMSFKQIAAERGYLDKNAAAYVYRVIKKLLNPGGSK